MSGYSIYLFKVLPLLACAVLLCSCGNDDSLARGGGPAILLPDAPRGWKESLETQAFSGISLSDYINGGAEAYYAYGF